MERPLKLHIIPQEAFPTQRLNSSQPPGLPQEVEDMPQMAAFVYEFYIQKVQAMKTAFYVRFIYFSLLKNMLKRRKESDIYLATLLRHRWSAQMTMKIDNKFKLSASTVAFISI